MKKIVYSRENYTNKKQKNNKNIVNNNTVKSRRYDIKNKSIVDQIRERRPVPNPWRVGEVAEIVIKKKS